MSRSVIHIDFVRNSSSDEHELPENYLQDLGGFLTSSQVEKVMEFKSTTRALEFLGVRKLLKDLIGRHIMNVTLNELRLAQDIQGKPFIKPLEDEISISLTHSKQWLGVCFRHGPSVGIDLEERSRRLSDALIARVGTDEEWLQSEINRNKLSLWVIKEAIVKCMGLGLQAHVALINVTALSRISTTHRNELAWDGCLYHFEHSLEEDTCFGFRACYNDAQNFTGILLMNDDLIMAVAQSTFE